MPPHSRIAGVDGSDAGSTTGLGKVGVSESIVLVTNDLTSVLSPLLSRPLSHDELVDVEAGEMHSCGIPDRAPASSDSGLVLRRERHQDLTIADAS